MKKTTKRNIIIVAVILCVIVATLFFISISFNLFHTTADQKNLTTDTWSNSFVSKEEKLSFLTEYLIAPSEILDAEYHIVYHDNSIGMVPGPSDWDIRAVLIIKPEYIGLWTEGFERIASSDVDLTWWDGLATDSVSWSGSAGECYKRSDGFSYLVVFPEAGIILKAVSTMLFPPKDNMKGGIELDDILLYFTTETAEGYAPPRGFDKKQESVAYGEIVELEYYSNTTESMRKCLVYTPPGYDPAKTYPVLYLLHGIGGTHSEWLGGEPNNVLSNLIADGEAVPMIAVFPNVRAMKDDGNNGNMFSAENFAAFDNFINDLRDDLMPFIKGNYSVSDKREGNAIAGLSMGGREALFIGVSLPETFAYVGAFCPAPGLMADNLGYPAQLAPAEMTLADEYKNNTFVLINAGNQDTVVGDSPRNYSEAFTANGIEHAFYSIDGGHSFDVWKNGLYWFARCVFKQQS